MGNSQSFCKGGREELGWETIATSQACRVGGPSGCIGFPTCMQPHTKLGAAAGQDSLSIFSNWSLTVTGTSPFAPTIGQFSPFSYL